MFVVTYWADTVDSERRAQQFRNRAAAVAFMDECGELGLSCYLTTW